MTYARSLLEILKGSIERTYGMDTGIVDIHRFVVGDRGHARLCRGRSIRSSVESRLLSEARVLVRQHGGDVFAVIYYPDALIAELERRNPLFGLGEENLDAFAVFVEELDHLLTLADRSRACRPVRLLDLELHANVTKYIASRHFLERTLGRPLDAGERLWLRWSLFEKHEAPEEPPELQRRYREADRLGRAFAEELDRLRPAARIEELRRFHALTTPGAVRRLDELRRGGGGESRHP